jgi:hypothetical protein
MVLSERGHTTFVHVEHPCEKATFHTTPIHVLLESGIPSGSYFVGKTGDFLMLQLVAKS